MKTPFLFNPYTGAARDPADVASDPADVASDPADVASDPLGALVVPPGAPLHPFGEEALRRIAAVLAGEALREDAAKAAPANHNGHGHVRPRPDGVKARCGGPAFCSACQRERAALESYVRAPGADPQPTPFIPQPTTDR